MKDNRTRLAFGSGTRREIRKLWPWLNDGIVQRRRAGYLFVVQPIEHQKVVRIIGKSFHLFMLELEQMYYIQQER